MSVRLEFFNIIIPIKKVEEHYPGGFEQYKKDHKLGVWYDHYLVREGAMNMMEIDMMLERWKERGLQITYKSRGIEKWKDVCVIDSFGGTNYWCDWLVIKNGKAAYKEKSKFSSHDKREEMREFRKEIFNQTFNMVFKGYYELDGKQIEIDNKQVIDDTVYYKKPDALSTDANNKFETKFSVIEADCLEAAELLMKSGFSVCVLNMANRQKPGGGVFNGAGAQEENIFRRTNIFLSLFQFSDIAEKYGIKRNKNSYPLDRNSGGIYSRDVTVFRGSERNDYCMLKNPFKLSFVSVPAINKPRLELIDGEYRIGSELIEPSKEKIRTILRIEGGHEHDCLILGAFGCGAFKNPPKHMAELFKEVFQEQEFLNRFKVVVFAILNDHNNRKEHNPRGNMQPFLEVFG